MANQNNQNKNNNQDNNQNNENKKKVKAVVTNAFFVGDDLYPLGEVVEVDKKFLRKYKNNLKEV